MTDEDVVSRVAGLFGVRYHKCKPQQSHHRVSYFAHLRGKRAVELMKCLRPLMGIRRQSQIDQAVAAYIEHPPWFQKITSEQAEEIEQRRAAGEKPNDLAIEFGVTKWTVYAIKQGRRSRGPSDSGNTSALQAEEGSSSLLVSTGNKHHNGLVAETD